MRRHAIGVIAIALLGVGIFFLIWPPRDSALQWLHGSSVRIGVVLLAVWLAWPEISRVPRWMYGLVTAGILIVMIQPKLVAFVVPALVVVWFLRPREKT